MGVTAENRTLFVNAVMAIVNKYGVDGVEIEYAPPPFLKRVFDPFIIIVGSFRIKRRVVTRFLPMIPPIFLSSCKP